MKGRTEAIAQEIWNALAKGADTSQFNGYAPTPWGDAPADTQAQFRRAAQAAETAAENWDRTMPLSPRQREVLELAARGRTASEIGQILGVSYGTAREHRDLAVANMDAVNLTQAVAKAVSRGFVSLDESPRL